MDANDPYDALVIGGGFYGCAIALHLRRRGLARVLLVEREKDLLTRASYANQARVHNGYHYPRNFVTAWRSHINFPRFCADFGFAIDRGYQSLYAIAARRSKVAPAQFERFMRDVGQPYEIAAPSLRRLFSERLIARVYLTEEYAFDALGLRAHFVAAIAQAGVEVRLDTEALQVAPCGAEVSARLVGPASAGEVRARLCINCGYAGLNRNTPIHNEPRTPLKHETTEVALVDVPEELAGIGVTVMDGPFFSCMPFPAERCHSFTHVRYTPHGHVIDGDGARDLVRDLAADLPPSRYPRMVADAARYVPALSFLRYRRSLFEIKTVLTKNEADDGRPILFRHEPAHPRLFSVLGGKIDGIYDALERLDEVIRA